MKYSLNHDKHFMPIIKVLRDFKANVLKSEHKTLKICVERNNGYNFIYTLEIYANPTAEQQEQNYQICERLVKSILWVAGGYKIYICGDEYVYNRIASDYSATGARAFDFDLMAGVYENPFEVVYATEETFPAEKSYSLAIGGHLDGCRIGFDAGGSDRKVSAVIDGEGIQ